MIIRYFLILVLVFQFLFLLFKIENRIDTKNEISYFEVKYFDSYENLNIYSSVNYTLSNDKKVLLKVADIWKRYYQNDGY